MRDLKILDHGEITFVSDRGWNTAAKFSLLLIGCAWDRGCDFEDLADGFGEGMGTMGGDWSGVRDSSHAAIEAMLERAMNHLNLNR
jgi:hypothetical protein